MSKIRIILDVSKVNKSKIVDREYTNREGKRVIKKEYAMELQELNKPTVIKSGEGWVLKKTHFLAEAQTKEEKEAKTPLNFIGDGTQFFSVSEDEVTVKVPEQKENTMTSEGADGEVIDIGDIPF